MNMWITLWITFDLTELIVYNITHISCYEYTSFDDSSADQQEQ